MPQERPDAHGDVPVTAPAGLRVLLVEDDPVTGVVTRAQLERLGHAVTSVPAGDDAVAAASRGGHDVLVVDLGGGTSGPGHATVVSIRALAGTSRHLPVVALSSGTGPEPAPAGSLVDVHVARPATPEQLASALERVTVAPTATPTPPSEDVDAILDRLVVDMGGRREPVERAIRSFLADLPGVVDTIVGAVDDETVRQAAHRLKGSARLLGVRALGEVSARLEVGTTADRDAHLDELRREVRRAEDALDAYLTSEPPIR